MFFPFFPGKIEKKTKWQDGHLSFDESSVEEFCAWVNAALLFVPWTLISSYCEAWCILFVGSTKPNLSRLFLCLIQYCLPIKMIWKVYIFIFSSVASNSKGVGFNTSCTNGHMILKREIPYDPSCAERLRCKHTVMVPTCKVVPNLRREFHRKGLLILQDIYLISSQHST